MITWEEPLVSDLARRRAVLFIGAGVSKSSISRDGKKRPPLWREFLELALKECRGTTTRHIKHLLKENDLLTACEITKIKLGHRWNELLEREFVHPQYSPSDLHKGIFKLDARLVISFNFDKIYDSYALAESGTTTHTVSYYDADLARLLRGDYRAIVKAHGSIEHPDKMIFTRGEYAQAKVQYSPFYSMLDALALTHTCLFIGCGLNDPDVHLFLERYANNYSSTSPHYIILPKPMNNELKKALEKNFNLKIILYDPKNDHRELVDSINKLVTLVEASRTELSRNQNW
jgi:hypothetical protein